jgi:hypothetical protein
MHPEDMRWYADRARWAADPPGADGVLLIGGFQGYANFGDVLQVKGVARWHREVTGLRPVLALSTTAIADGSFGDRMRAWLGIDDLVYWSERPLDATSIGLAELRRAPRIPHLHLFGGECLTLRWGELFLALIESAHRRFGVGHYAISGQQAEAAAVPLLRAHFGRHPPVLAGGRDADSAEHLAAAGAHADHSFDDALEAMERLVREGTTTPGPPAGLLVHLNLSYYTAPAAGDGAAARRELARDLDALRRALPPADEVALLQAFDDRRADEITDTLGTVVELEDGFPFAAYRVVDLARLALALDDEPLPAGLPAPARLAYACSYHVTVLCGLLGIPCFLRAQNPYYRQKRTGLGLAAHGALDDFLDRPVASSLEAQRRARAAWLERLASAYSRPAEPRQPHDAVGPAAPAAPWRPKPGIRELRARHR